MSEACAERDALFRQLGQAGWCFGREGEIEARKEWRRCDEASPAGGGAGLGLVVEPTAAAAALRPHDYFEKAQASFAARRREDATFWLYAAQLCWRARLAAHSELTPSGEPILFASLMEVVGRPINEHAFGDVREATAIIDRVLAFDAANPDRLVPEDVRARPPPASSPCATTCAGASTRSAASAPQTACRTVDRRSRRVACRAAATASPGGGTNGSRKRRGSLHRSRCRIRWGWAVT